MGWIDDEFSSARIQNERRQILRSQSGRLRDELLQLLRKQVAEIDAKAPAYGVTLKEQTYGAEIRNTTLPSVAINVLVNWAAMSIKIEVRHARDFFDPQRHRPKTEHLSLALTAEDKLFVVGPNGDMIWPEDICEYVLRPLVRLILNPSSATVR